MTTTTEAGWSRPVPPLMPNGQAPIRAFEASSLLDAVVQRFERGEIGLAQAEREMQPILARVPEFDRSMLCMQSVLGRFRAAREEQGQARIAQARDDRQAAGPRGPEARLAGALRGVRIPPGANQRAVDEAVSGAFPDGARFLRDLQGLSPAQVRRAVEATGLRGEQADRALHALGTRAVMALTQQTTDQVARSFDSLVQKYTQPSRQTLDQLAGELSSSSRVPALQGLAALGVSEQALERVESLSPPADDAEAAELRQALRGALSECATAVREERDRILSGSDAIREWATGDVLRTFPEAAQAAAGRFGIHGEHLRLHRAGIGRPPTFVEQSVAEHVDGAEARRIGRDITVTLLKHATDIAFGVATGGAGFAGTLVELGVGAATGAIDVESADRRARLTEIAFRAGVAGEEAARQAQAQADDARRDLAIGLVRTGLSSTMDAGFDAAEASLGEAAVHEARYVYDAVGTISDRLPVAPPSRPTVGDARTPTVRGREER